MAALNRYHDNLANPVTPGAGAHSYIMSTANYGVMAGIAPQTIHNDIRRIIPKGNRRISDREIADAINKAMQDFNGGKFSSRPRPEPVVKNGAMARQRIINSAKIHDESDIWELSPIRIDWPPEEDVRHAL